MTVSEVATANGLRVREQVTSFLTSERLANAVGELRRTPMPGLVLDDVIDPALVTLIRADLEEDPGWNVEYWILQDDGDVLAVDEAAFEAADPDRRFSCNACLRKPAATSLALRSLLSGLVSPEVKTALSLAYGEGLKFASADIAKYGPGDYIRRHSDTFSDRRLGLVWFLGDTRPAGSGGELVVESPTGDSLVVEPTGGSVAVFVLRESYSHLVATVRSSTWTRYSVGSHYSLDARPAS